MTLSQADQNLALINARLMAKIALLEQEKEQIKHQYETRLAELH